ncbi:2-oxo-4-hydroxy-4-carboxy-5-ureidoimidazoline decarboxylase [Granulicella tundricola]|uniref:2-oxo-4-hydroxy-4-carboxy-5-ureidoimidazoline decarboxylase n=1 Tax=Granulicella tundricola (strain ATCC BAA-1859 / DSM 23138 / MP5ACTX9) TaxID=1198114 RepID=E8WYX8_GRATM|nr:2-oxo-4-hydroxy-4-carboxy-5-ureidoimidazoline decarboxylase [Granulicella tundricola]ADW69893.1 OHCU decarboxylase [Granulicella tundricola MP5ACTX9]
MLNGPAMNEILARWNEMDEVSAEAEVLPCNGSTAWAQGLAHGRPYADETAVYAASEKVWLGLTQDDWLAAFATHPRIGEKHAAASAKALAWSSSEQREAMAGEAYEAELLAEGNREYEAKFGRTFLICASGRSKREILEMLKARMSSTEEEEMNEAAEQQKQITRLRLQRWLRGE